MKRTLYSLCCVLLLLSPWSYAQKINVVAGMNKPPYIYQQNGEAKGFEVELVEQILKKMGFEPEFHLIPFARSMRMLTDDNIDAIMTASPLVFKDKSILSKPYVSYQNKVISLQQNEIEISRIIDLANYPTAAFQMASKVLGRQYQTASELSPYYVELAEQSRQLEMLQQDKVKALVMDINIFNYFKIEDYPNVDIHSVFPVSRYGMAFKKTELVRHFNRTWLSYKKSDEYRSLLKKYKMEQNL